ncbi:MAG TPA: SRPBCC family protein [Coriobacteriia bacterium]|nr:SRPBCC family protein [Coriobacteriia bacterium]
MAVDVTTHTLIQRPRHDVASYVADPDNAPKWYVNIEAVKWETPPPIREGSRLAFIAHFLGQRLAYTYEVVEYIPEERLVMRTVDGPFPMETTYTWDATSDAETDMVLRNRGNPRGFSMVVAPLMAYSMRRENQKDLARLKQLLEAPNGAEKP